MNFSVDISPELNYKNGYYPGVSGTALCVTNEKFEMPHHDYIDPTQFTVEFWVNIPDSLNYRKGGWLINKGSNRKENGYYGIQMDNRGKLNSVINVGGKLFNVSQKKNSFIDYTKWNHIALSYDGFYSYFYINGILQGKDFINGTRVSNKSKFQLSSKLDGKKRSVSALFDNLRIWDRSLMKEEIKSVLNTSKNIEEIKGLRFYENFDVSKELVNVTPKWKNVTVRMKLNDQETKKHISNDWEFKDSKKFILNCNFNSNPPPGAISMQLNTKEGDFFPVKYKKASNSYVATIKDKQVTRAWAVGAKEIKNYDVFDISIFNNTGREHNVPFLLDLSDVANITGICPILCDEKGIPTGIPIQLSKNWHDNLLGDYLKSYMILPAKLGKTVYKLRIVYGFYGTLPSASHAQLSLIGYGGNGRWDQMSIGCWGETMCQDMDMSLVDVAITDVRVLMARKGLKGKKWNWTDAGWGGDWLGLWKGKNKLSFSELKIAYFSHGPCLTDVRYNGFYGVNRNVSLDATVNTLRTDDYVRTFYNLNYKFNTLNSIKKGWLFKMGGDGNFITPKVFYGNKKGLLGEVTISKSARKGDYILNRLELKGEGPWWITFPNSDQLKKNDLATGYRALIIRNYESSFEGVKYFNPSLSLPVFKNMNVNCTLVPPEGVNSVNPGDYVKLDLEWITLPRIAEDYYGPNEVFRTHLKGNPNSWKTVYREVIGNDLKVSVSNGVLLNNYPVVVKIKGRGIALMIEGGVGAVPVQFKGLKSYDGYTLYKVEDGNLVVFDQSTFGNDFWQTDFDSKTQTYTRTYNLPLDDVQKSKWILYYDTESR